MRGRVAVVLLLGLVAAAAAAAQPAKKVPTLVFPVIGPTQYFDDFGQARPGGPHQGNDILAPKRAIAVAAEAGRVKFWTTSAGAGCMLYLYGASGTTYLYIHLNNDLGLGNDNRGKCVAGSAYAPGLKDGAKVSAGQPVGFVGDSGDANGGASHLHFEVHPNGGNAVSPFPYLQAADHLLFATTTTAPVTLSLKGTVLSASPTSLKLHVSRLAVIPDGTVVEDVPQALTLELPPQVNVAIGRRNDSGRTVLKGANVSLLTLPAKPTLALRLGRGLVAAQILVG